MTISAATASLSSGFASQFVSRVANSTSPANFADILTKAQNEKNQNKATAASAADSSFSSLMSGNGSSSSFAAMLINGNGTVSQVANNSQNGLASADILG